MSELKITSQSFGAVAVERVKKSLEKIKARCESRNIKAEFEIREVKLKSKQAFKISKRKNPNFMCECGKGFDLNVTDTLEKRYRRLEFTENPNEARHHLFLWTHHKTPVPCGILENAKSVMHTPLFEAVFTYDPPTKWEVIAHCAPSDPNNPHESPALWTTIGDNTLPEKINRKKLPDKFLDQCDHCSSGKKRRKSVLIVKSPKKQLKIVGSSCLLSYTGIDPKDIDYLMNLARHDRQNDGYAGWTGGRYTETYDTGEMQVLIAAYAQSNKSYRSGLGNILLGQYEHMFIKFDEREGAWELGRLEKKYGWSSFQPKVFLPSWIHHDTSEMFGYNIRLICEAQRPPQTDILIDSFNQAIEAMRDDKPSEFTRKVLAVQDSGVVYKKTWNVYAGASSRWLKTVHEKWYQAVKDAKGDTQKPTSRLPHDVGERITVEAVFVEQRHTKNGYVLTEFRTPNHEAIVTFGKCDVSDFKPNQKVTVTGTITRHGSWQGNESTTINRVNLGGSV